MANRNPPGCVCVSVHADMADWAMPAELLHHRSCPLWECPECDDHASSEGRNPGHSHGQPSSRDSEKEQEMDDGEDEDGDPENDDALEALATPVPSASKRRSRLQRFRVSLNFGVFAS